MAGEHTHVLVPGSLMRKEMLGHGSITRREIRLGGAGHTLTSCSSLRQPGDPKDSRFTTEQLRHQRSHPPLLALAASGVSPSSKLKRSWSRGFRPSWLTWGQGHVQPQQPETSVTREKVEVAREEKAPRERSCGVYDVASSL